MSEAEPWVSLGDVPSVADESWLYNGGGPLEASSWEPISLAELPDEPPVQPTLGGLGLVYPGKRHVFSGPQESAKTLAAYAIALEIIREGGRVVLVDFEMGQWDARNRLLELGASKDELRMISYVEPSERATPVAIQRLVELEPRLLLVDAAAGAYDMQELDDNKRSDVERFTSVYVRPFWLAGIASIVLDHVVKNTEGRGKYAIGSERKVGGADVHLGFEVVSPIKRGGSGTYKIITHKDRGGFLKRGKLADFELRSDPETHSIAWNLVITEALEDEPFRPTHLMERVSRYLQDHGTSSQTKIEEAVSGRAEFIRQAIDRLIVEGHASESEGPRRARMVTSIRVYLEAKDDYVPPRPAFIHAENEDQDVSSDENRLRMVEPNLKTEAKTTPSHPVPTPSRTESTDRVPPRPPLTGGRDAETTASEERPRPDFSNDDIPF